jgi:hypothetical protein
MTKLVAAIRRSLAGAPDELPVHFHQGMTEDSPEVCFEDACERPQLAIA